MDRLKVVLRWRTLAKLLFIAILLIAANFAVDRIAESLNFQIRPMNEDLVHRTITVAAVLYTVLLAIPFVPGAEIGLALISMLGPPIVFLVYVCTVVGLSLSFIVGRLIPLGGLVAMAADLRLHRTAGLLRTIQPLDQKERLAFLASKAPSKYLPLLLRHRYIALALALNIPGNFLIGGGGGISMIAGISQLYSLPGFLITIAIAVTPVPIAILIFGNEIL